MAEVRVGPDQEEIDELRKEDPDESTSRDKYWNQCLFVRTLNLTFDDDDWEIFNHEIEAGYTINSVTEHGAGTPLRSTSNRGAPSTHHRHLRQGRATLEFNEGRATVLLWNLPRLRQRQIV